LPAIDEDKVVFRWESYVVDPWHPSNGRRSWRGSSGLDFAGNPGVFTNVCIGAATSLDIDGAFFDQPYLPGTAGTVLLNFGDRDLVSASAPQITVLSSANTSAAPAPASILLECICLAVITVFARRWIWVRRASRQTFDSSIARRIRKKYSNAVST
jgi:hypothetical protein